MSTGDIVISIVGIIMSFIVGVSLGINMAMDKAIDNGAACYYLDEDNEKTFKWGSCE